MCKLQKVVELFQFEFLSFEYWMDGYFVDVEFSAVAAAFDPLFAFLVEAFRFFDL